MRILLVSDSFPPNCGGSGWSTYELARGLRARGHDVRVVRPRPGQQGRRSFGYEGFEVDEVGAFAPSLPFVRNYFKNERLWQSLERVISARIQAEAIDVVHGQHVLTAIPAIRAARRSGVPSVATIRDYWPVCYWSDLILDPAMDGLCPECSSRNMTCCVRPHAGAAWPAALPAIPYMRGNLARKRQGLAAADAIVAVSSTIGSDLEARAPELAAKLRLIPNPVDIVGIRAQAESAPRPLSGAYVLYSGKLEMNKGADLLVPAALEAGLPCPLVVVGDGKLRERIANDARDRGLDVRMLGWLPRDQALAWVRHASALMFPSRGPESLSRVLLEAGALGVPIAAMDTGGTRDIIRHGETGLLSSSWRGMARDLGRLLCDAPLAGRLGDQARQHVENTFDSSHVVSRVEALYDELTGSRRRVPSGA